MIVLVTDIVDEVLQIAFRVLDQFVTREVAPPAFLLLVKDMANHECPALIETSKKVGHA